MLHELLERDLAVVAQGLCELLDESDRRSIGGDDALLEFAKTSLLTALLSLPAVAEGGVLLLAPTGKARVQMQKRAKSAQAFKLAQFLLGLGRYDPLTGRYKVTDVANRERGFKTVIIDESSMLTEDQLAATLDAIETTTVERLILVGEPPVR